MAKRKKISPAGRKKRLNKRRGNSSEDREGRPAPSKRAFLTAFKV
jgi:hypothetical protein